MGPLHNISFEVGMDANTENNFLAPAKRDVVAGLQFAFDLPYKGYFNVAPLVYWEFLNHNAFTQCGLFGSRRCRADLQPDGNITYNADMGGRNQLLHGPGLPAREHAVLLDQRPRRLVRTEGRSNNTPCLSGLGRFTTATKTEFNSEPIRLTFDASKAFMGSEVLALRRPLGCLSLLAEQVRPRPQCDARRLHRRGNRRQSTNSCTESTVYAGVTVKF